MKTHLCRHYPYRRLITGAGHTAHACNRTRCIGAAVKWVTRHSDHALIENIKEDQ